MGQGTDGDAVDPRRHPLQGISERDIARDFVNRSLRFDGHGRGGQFRIEIVEHDHLGFQGQSLVQFCEILDFHLDGQFRMDRTNGAHRLTDRAGHFDVIFLDQGHGRKVAAMVVATAMADSPFFQIAEQRRGLAGVQHAERTPGEKIDKTPGERGDAAQVLQKIQSHPFGAQNPAQASPDHGHEVGHLDPGSVQYRQIDFGGRIEELEGPFEKVQARHHAGRLGDDAGLGRPVPVQQRAGRHIVFGMVLGESLADQGIPIACIFHSGIIEDPPPPYKKIIELRLDSVLATVISGMLKWNMLQISSPERCFRLPQGSYLLGRTLPCHLLVQEITVSGEHCRIWHQPEGWRIKDIGSTNGTVMDGMPLVKNQEYPLPRQSRIKLGTVTLDLQCDESDETGVQAPFPLILLSRQEETSTINQKTLYTAMTRTREPGPEDDRPAEMTSRCPAVLRIYQEARELAKSGLPVAIEGETGTGKELLAGYIHAQSGRKGELITLVPTTNEPLQESEFFGYRKGAFTGADRDYPGKIKLAANGTLFLDELSHIPHSLQVRLLRFLENGEIFPLGAQRAETVRVRLLVASNIPFRNLVKNGSLREDFYYRLCIHTLSLPPLRERADDILPLFCHFFSPSSPYREDLLAEETAVCLLRYSWPGNIRELKAEAQRLRLKATLLEQITADHLSPALRGASEIGSRPSPLTDNGRDEREKRIIQETLNQCRGNKSLAAEQLQISRRGLYKKMKRLGMDV